MYGFMYDGYDLRQRWVMGWESIILLRKLAIIAILTFFDDANLHSACGGIVIAVALLFQILVAPYYEAIHDLLEGGALFMLLFTQFFALLDHMLGNVRAKFVPNYIAHSLSYEYMSIPAHCNLLTGT